MWDGVITKSFCIDLATDSASLNQAYLSLVFIEYWQKFYGILCECSDFTGFFYNSALKLIYKNN